jgi:hypothetical protein
MSIDVLDGRIAVVRKQINPAKLGHLGPMGDLTAMLGSEHLPRRE